MEGAPLRKEDSKARATLRPFTSRHDPGSAAVVTARHRKRPAPKSRKRHAREARLRSTFARSRSDSARRVRRSRTRMVEGRSAAATPAPPRGINRDCACQALLLCRRIPNGLTKVGARIAARRGLPHERPPRSRVEPVSRHRLPSDNSANRSPSRREEGTKALTSSGTPPGGDGAQPVRRCAPAPLAAGLLIGRGLPPRAPAAAGGLCWSGK